MSKGAKIALGAVLGAVLIFGGCMAVVGGVAEEWDSMNSEGTGERGNASDKVTGQPDDITFKSPKIDPKPDEWGTWEGTIKVKNHSDETRDVIVTVTIYDGTVALAEFFGDSKVKAGASQPIDLISLDEYDKGMAAWDNYEVEIESF